MSKMILREIRVCVASGCDNTFEVIITSEKRFCCGGHSRIGKGRPKGSGKKREKDRELRFCELSTCNNIFECRNKEDRRFCSQKCAASDPGHILISIENFRKASINAIGTYRSEEIKRKISDTETGKIVSEETRKRMSKARIGRFIGKNSPSWQGGVSFEPYTEEFNYQLKESIRQRDDNTCQLCNKTQEKEGKRLTVHHIDYDKENCSETNLITLCRSCNGKVNFNRKYWIEFFQQKLELFEGILI